MSHETATRETIRPSRRNISRAIIPLAIFAFLGVFLVSNAPGEIGRWKMAIARRQFAQHKPENAMETAKAAQAWDRNDLSFGLQRVAWYQSQHDFEAAIGVLNEMLAVAAGNRKVEIALLELRSGLLQNLSRHQQAIADADQVVDYWKSSGNELAILHAYNMRAYTVARAASVGQATPKQIGTALLEMRDVRRLWYRDREVLGVNSPVLERQFNYRLREVTYLDTFAYLQLFASKRFYQPSLQNLNRCVESCDQMISLANDYAEDDGNFKPMTVWIQQLEANKAVIIHHRGEAYAALGNADAAQEDFQTAKQLGYDRKTGNW